MKNITNKKTRLPQNTVISQETLTQYLLKWIPENDKSNFIDDIRIYNRALSESEIQALYHEGGWGQN